MLVIALIACAAPTPAPEASTDASPPASPDADHFLLRGAALPGGEASDVEVQGGQIVAVTPAGEGDPALESVDLSGYWLAPGFIDSHVHMAYYPVADELAAAGVVAAVDLAAPESIFSADHGALELIASGPMVTAEGGYPTRSWGAGGYGSEVSGAASAAAEVERLAGLGAGVIKLPVTSEPTLGEDALAAAAGAAAGLGLRVASHALSDDQALIAAQAGADALAHTPTEALSDEALDAWADRAVVSTLGAFGGGAAAVENLAALRARGAAVLYGTDLGNTRFVGVDPEEIALLLEAGLDGAAVLAAGTSIPAAYWGLDHLGEIAPGRDASLMVLAEDPVEAPLALSSPTQIYVRGVAQID